MHDVFSLQQELVCFKIKLESASFEEGIPLLEKIISLNKTLKDYGAEEQIREDKPDYDPEAPNLMGGKPNA